MHAFAKINAWQLVPTFVDPTQSVVFLVVYAHQDRQRHSFCAPPFPMVHVEYKQFAISTAKVRSYIKTKNLKGYLINRCMIQENEETKRCIKLFANI